MRRILQPVRNSIFLIRNPYGVSNLIFFTLCCPDTDILVLRLAVAPNYPIKIVPRLRGIGRGRQVVPLVSLDTQHSAVPPNVSANVSASPVRRAEGEKRGSQKDYKRIVCSLTQARRDGKPKHQREGISAATTAPPSLITDLPSKPTVTVKKRPEIHLANYKPLSPQKIAKARILRKEKLQHSSSSPSKETPQKPQELEPSAPAAETQLLTPKSRIVGTGYHHLPASDKPFPSALAGPSCSAELAQEVTTLQAAAVTARIFEGRRQVRPLYPWLPADRGMGGYTHMKNLGVAFKGRSTPSGWYPREKGKGKAKER
jgi:hypothetical protein